MRRAILWTLAFTLLVLAGWAVHWVFFQPPKTQVLHAQQRFLRAVEKRDWEKVKSMLTDDYGDEFGLDRETITPIANEVLKGFISFGLEGEVTRLQAVPDLGMVKMKIEIVGSGVGAAPLVMATANKLKEPWIFHWHKKGNWPWSWKIVQIENIEAQGYAGYLERLLEETEIPAK